MTQSSQADLHQLFGMLDSDGGGTIDPEEFKQTLTSHFCCTDLGSGKLPGLPQSTVCFGKLVPPQFFRILGITVLLIWYSEVELMCKYIYIYIYLFLQLYLYYISILASVHWSFPLNYPLIGQNSEDGTSMLRLPIVLFVMPWSSSWKIMPMLHKNSVPWRSVSQQYLPGNVSGWKGGDHHIGWPCDFWRKWKLQVERFVEVMIFSGGQWFTDHAWLWELWIDDDSSWSLQALDSTKALYREQAAVAKAERKKFKQLRGWQTGFWKHIPNQTERGCSMNMMKTNPLGGEIFNSRFCFPCKGGFSKGCQIRELDN